jgi:hypothetical protein
VREFLRGHSCYELIPESGKVVLLDMGLPIRQAFHALHEQARAPGARPPTHAAAPSPAGCTTAWLSPVLVPRRRAAPPAGRRKSKTLP